MTREEIKAYESQIHSTNIFNRTVIKKELEDIFDGYSEPAKKRLEAMISNGVSNDLTLKYELYKIKDTYKVAIEGAGSFLAQNIDWAKDICLVDYTCSQGYELIRLVDRLEKEKQLKSKITDIYIVDSNADRLERTILNLNAYIPQAKTTGISKAYYDVTPDDMPISSMYAVHLFGDVIEKSAYCPESFKANLKYSSYLFSSYIFYKIEADCTLEPDEVDEERVPSHFCDGDSIVSYLNLKISHANVYPGGNDSQIYFIGSIDTLEGMSLNKNGSAQSLLVDDINTSHITKLFNLYYQDDLLPVTKHYDKSDLMRQYSVNDPDIIAENFLIYRIASLAETNKDLFNQVVSRYESLAKHGCYEAYNNLGVIKIMTCSATEETEREFIFKEASELFLKAAEKGSTRAMINLLSYYRGENDETNAEYYVEALASLYDEKGLWEKATSLMLGSNGSKDIDGARSIYQTIVDTASENSGYYKRNAAIYNLARLEYDNADNKKLVGILKILESSGKPSTEIENMRAVILARLGFEREAISIFRRLSNEKYIVNHLPEYNLACCQMSGIGLNEKDYKDAEVHLLNLVKANDDGKPIFPRGYFALGNLYHKLGNDDKAIEALNKSIEFDQDTRCAAMINIKYFAQDWKGREEAIDTIMKERIGCKECHEANNYDYTLKICPKCQLWSITSSGDRDSDTIIEKMRLPAEQGLDMAQYSLGKRYEESDIEKSRFWIRLAAEQDYSIAQKSLIADKRKNKVFDNDTIFWAGISANKGDSYAQYMLHMLLQNNEKESKLWLHKAADSGLPAAQLKIGQILYKENKVNEAIGHLCKSAKQGNKEANDFLNSIIQSTPSLNKPIMELLTDNSMHTKASAEEINNSLNDDGILILDKSKKRLLGYKGYCEDTVEIQEGVETICDDCFNDMYYDIDNIYLKKIVLPESLKYIGSNAFNFILSSIDCRSKNFVIENHALFTADRKVLIRYLGDDDVYYVPDGTVKIEGGAFLKGNVKKVTIPSSVLIIGSNAFAGCSVLEKDITLDIKSEHFVFEKSMLIDTDSKKLIAYLGSEDTVNVPKGISSIGRDAFFCAEIKKVCLPDSISEIDNDAFSWCFSLKHIEVPSGKGQYFRNILPEYIIKGQTVSLSEATGEVEMKEDHSRISTYLKEHDVPCFYHFTDIRNIQSIREHGGLYSWSYCENNSITITCPGGDSNSRSLDQRYGLEDYVRVSFCNDHPMAYRLKEQGSQLVILKISPKVAEFKGTLFSDINATDGNHKHGGNIEDLKRIDIAATKQNFVSKDSPIFKKHQAEVLVKSFIPSKYILNLDNPTIV